MKAATQHSHRPSFTKKSALHPPQDLGIFFLPEHILSSLVLETPTATTPSTTIASIEPSQTATSLDDTPANTHVEQTHPYSASLSKWPARTGDKPSCRTCGIAELPSVEAQRKHVKSDWHQYNLKHRLLDGQAQPVSQERFENLLQGLLSSDLQGESNAGDHRDQVQTLFKKLEVTVHEHELCEEVDPQRQRQQRLLVQQCQKARMSPMIWFTSTIYGPTVRLGVYKNALANRAQGCNPLELLQSIQIPVPPSPPKKKKVKRAARAALLAKADQMEPSESLDIQNTSMAVTDQDADVRRKQGGTQSTHAGCNSAGAMVRMYNERALKLEVRELLEGWSQWIEQSEFIFMHAPGNNRRVLFHENSVITLADREGRVRSIPFVTRRPTLTELKRVYQDLSSVTVKVVSDSPEETACANVEPEQVDLLDKTLVPEEPVPQEQVQPSTTSNTPQDLQRLVDMVKKGRVEAMSNYLARTGLNPSLLLPKSSRSEYDRAKTPTLLHLASLHGQARIVQQLLEVHGADPTTTMSSPIERSSQEPTPDHLLDVASPIKSWTAYDLAINKETRNAFRSAMAKMPDAWDWVRQAHVPSALLIKAEEREQPDTLRKGKLECDQRQGESKAEDRRVCRPGTSSRGEQRPVLETAHAQSQGDDNTSCVISVRERIAQAAEARLAASRRGGSADNSERVMTGLQVPRPLSKRNAKNRAPFTARSTIVPHVQKTTRSQSGADRRANNGK
ncbi:hypothetical protein BGZ72_003012 [Mortierella alpina]|nr:hypothetical protein BGZ72_003012 [Mortierella alpina]